MVPWFLTPFGLFFLYSFPPCRLTKQFTVRSFPTSTTKHFFFLMTLCRFFIKLFSVSYWEKEKNKKTINCREFSSSLRFILLRQNSIQAARDKYLLWGFCGLKHCDYKNAVEWRQHFEIIQKKKLVIYSGWNDYKKKKMAPGFVILLMLISEPNYYTLAL